MLGLHVVRVFDFPTWFVLPHLLLLVPLHALVPEHLVVLLLELVELVFARPAELAVVPLVEHAVALQTLRAHVQKLLDSVIR